MHFSGCLPYVVCPFELTSDQVVYSLYDIYNNAYTLGGKLHVTLDRFLVYNSPSDISFSESKMKATTKYGNRDKISDATLRLGIVVKSLPVE